LGKFRFSKLIFACVFLVAAFSAQSKADVCPGGLESVLVRVGSSSPGLVRAGLRRGYGPRVLSLSDAEVARLQHFEEGVREALRQGVIDENATVRLRRSAANAILSHASLRGLGLKQVDDLYHQMQSSHRFDGSSGSRVRERFLAVFEDLLRDKAGSIGHDDWQLLTREEKLGVAEGRLAPDQAQAIIAQRRVAKLPSQASGTREPATEVVLQEVRASSEVQQLREKHRVFRGLRETDNKRYLTYADEADEAAGLGDGKSIYFERENAIIKDLNDHIIHDKELVTALDNLDKEIFHRNLMESPLLSKQVDASYSDFKSMRFRFHDNSPAMRQELSRVYEKSAREFAAAVEKTPIARLYKSSRGIAHAPESWHLAGIGDTPDMASRAARHARSSFRDGHRLTPMQDFSLIGGELDDILDATEILRSKLARDFSQNPGIMTRSPGGRPVLSDDAVEVLRKVKVNGTLEDYMAVVQQDFKKFGVELTQDQVLDLRDYKGLSDSFSASIRSAKREEIDFSKAPSDILSVDIAGQGARNLSGTMAALADVAGKGPEAAVAASRQAERLATFDMAHRVNGFYDALSEVFGPGASKRVLISGDDILYFSDTPINSAQTHAFQALLANGARTSGYRPTRNPKNYGDTKQPIVPSDRSLWINRAESVEKGLRKALSRGVESARLKSLGFTIDLVPQEKSGGIVNVIVGGHIDDPVTLAKIKEEARTIVRQHRGMKLGSVEYARPGMVHQAVAPNAPRAPPRTGEISRRPEVEVDYRSSYPLLASMKATSLEKGSIILDSNCVIALEQARQGIELPPVRKNALKLLGRFDLARYRVADGNIVEKEHAARRGAIPSGWKSSGITSERLKLTVDRASPEYRNMIQLFESNLVGSSKGGMDRQIAADALFASTDPGVVATFITADKDVYNGLRRLTGTAEANVAVSTQEFVLQIKDSSGNLRSLRVIPVPKE
jgi:hypothetical protein